MRVRVWRSATTTKTLLLLLSLGLLAAGMTGAAIPAPGPAATGADGGSGLSWSNENSPAGGLGWGIGGSSELLVTSTIGAGSVQSTDNGANWATIPDFPIVEAQGIVADPTDPAHVLVAGFGGLARTTDAGATWDHIIENPRCTVAAVSETGRIAVSERTEGFNARIIVSDDGGASWTDVNAPIGSSSLYGLAFGPSDDHITVASISKTWVTTDGGATWTEESRGALSLAGDENGVLWRSGMGPFQKSADGGATWQDIPELNPRQITPRAGGGVFAATSDGVQFTADDGATWTNMGYGDFTWAVTGMVADAHVPGGVFLSHEGLGVLWVGPDENGAYALQGRTNGFPPVDLLSLGSSGDGSLLLAGGSLGLFASRDGGASWSHTGAGYGYQGVRATTANTDGSIVYAGGSTMFFWPFLLYSQDGGTTWDYVNVDIGGDGRVVAIVAHPDDPETAYAVVWGELTESQVIRTTNGGSDWETILVSDIPLFDGAWDAVDGRFLVATRNGVLGYDEGLGLWLPLLVSTSPVNAVATTPSYAYAGGVGSALSRTMPPVPAFLPWATTSATTLALAADAQTDTAYALLANNQIEACGGDLLVATCTTDSPPSGAFRDVLVTPDGAQVLVASVNAGLWRAPLGGA